MTKDTTILGVRLTNTGIGYTAQGWRFERFDATPAYWIAGQAAGDERFTKYTLRALVKALLASGDLVVDVKTEAA